VNISGAKSTDANCRLSFKGIRARFQKKICDHEISNRQQGELNSEQEQYLSPGHLNRSAAKGRRKTMNRAKLLAEI
jgi:hypothetical protein